MYSILDIDLDYFNLMPDATNCLRRLLTWADLPVAMVVERHNHAYAQWKNRWRKGGAAPSHILHVDEHHDMMNEGQRANIGNFVFHAMTIWPECRVHWQVQEAIDSPAMWLGDESWSSLRHRFSHGRNRPARWPKPDLVSVCTSPDFIAPELAKSLMAVILDFIAVGHPERKPNHRRHRMSLRAAGAP